MRLESLDLNLLLCLSHLLRETNVTRAAQAMGISQPSMSHRLRQLREVFDDALLVRVGKQMALTPKGRSLAPRIQNVIALVRDVVGEQPAFDPRTVRTKLRIASTAAESTVIVEPLLKRLRRLAPNMDLRLFRAGLHSVPDLLDGKLDLILGIELGGIARIPDAVRSQLEKTACQRLFKEHWVVVVRTEHRRGLGPMSLDEFVAADHLLMSWAGGERGFVDDLLEARGLQRRVLMTVPDFFQVLRLARKHDVVATVPASFARAASTGLQLLEPPIEMPRLWQCMWWHPRLTDDPRHAWIRSQIGQIAAEMNPYGGDREATSDATTSESF